MPRRLTGQGASTCVLSGLPAVEETIEEHGPELVHHFRAHAARRFDLPGELDGERVGGKADSALFTELEVLVELVDDILGKGVLQVVLKEG